MHFTIVTSLILQILLLFQLAKVSTHNGKLQLEINPNNNEDNAVLMTIKAKGKLLLSGVLGLSMPNAVGKVSLCTQTDYSECYRYRDFARLEINNTDVGCSHLIWTSSYARRLEDCFELLEGHHWYGGGETYEQNWPIEKTTRQEAPFVSGDMLQGAAYGSIVEPYWLISTGVMIKVDDTVPLFMSWTGGDTRRVCFVAKSATPYAPREELHLSYHVCVGNNFKEVHEAQILSGVIPKPRSLPDAGMLVKPFWSTWVQYNTAVTQSLVKDFAQRIVSEGFKCHSHIEIDDQWEPCYGEFKFDPKKFPDPSEMVQDLKSLGFRTTVWVHPFINLECPVFSEALKNGYLVKGSKGQTGLTRWWQGKNAGIVDFTNIEAVRWWTGRLRKLKEDFGIDSFKFDAGETSYLPVSPQFQNVSPETFPNVYSKAYVQAVAEFGGMVETRTGRGNQNLPIFTRILDRWSHWGHDNGLASVIPTVLQFSIVGYPFVLPDMVGGNTFEGKPPSKELFIRWMQLNAFLPAFQFSLAPWDYNDTEVIKIAQATLALRESLSDLLINAAQESVLDGTPIVRPLWWADPEDIETLNVDSEFFIGETLLVAPVLEEGAVTRDIYLPKGIWTAHSGENFEGPRWIRNFSAPLETVPFFLRGIVEIQLTNDMPQY